MLIRRRFNGLILPIAGIIAAIAFLILCIGIVAVLNSVKKNLDYVAKHLTV